MYKFYYYKRKLHFFQKKSQNYFVFKIIVLKFVAK